MIIESRVATITEYTYLCTSVGWQEVMNFEAAEQALPGSVAGITVLDDPGAPIAMGRIVGDGAIYFYIQDVVVHPDHQRRGIGTLVIRGLLEHIREHAPQHSFIGLFSVPDAVGFYERFGLAERDLKGLFTVRELLKSIPGQ